MIRYLLLTYNSNKKVLDAWEGLAYERRAVIRLLFYERMHNLAQALGQLHRPQAS